MKKKINIRLVFIAVLACIATTISITIVYYNLYQNQVRSDLKISAELLKDTDFFSSLDTDTSQIDLSEGLEELRVTWIASDGRVLYDNDAQISTLSNHADRPEVQEALQEGSGESIRRSDTMNRNTFYYAILLDNGSILRVATEAESIWSVFLQVAPLILVIILIIMGLCILLSHLLTKQLIKPIETMAENIDDMNLTPAYAELVPFAQIIRKQHTDVLSAAKARQDFTANVSHELKTPLTAISGYAELMENHMVDAKQQDHFAAEIRKNAERLLSLINDIIKLSELDRTEDNDGFEKLDLYELVAENLEDYSIAAKKNNVTVELLGDHTTIFGKRDLIRELTDNLVQNAIRYNNENGRVWITVHSTETDGPELIVKDNGIGIPASEQSRIFERFYRVDKSRSKETGGTGLGLAIVKHIVEIHDAELTLDSAPGAGTTIIIHF